MSKRDLDAALLAWKSARPAHIDIDVRERDSQVKQIFDKTSHWLTLTVTNRGSRQVDHLRMAIRRYDAADKEEAERWCSEAAKRPDEDERQHCDVLSGRMAGLKFWNSYEPAPDSSTGKCPENFEAQPIAVSLSTKLQSVLSDEAEEYGATTADVLAAVSTVMIASALAAEVPREQLLALVGAHYDRYKDLAADYQATTKEDKPS